MRLNQLVVGMLAAVQSLSTAPVSAEKAVNEAGILVCVNDKWDEKEQEKGHKLVNYAGRCVRVPDDPAEAKDTANCVGKYEYMPDESWKHEPVVLLRFEDEPAYGFSPDQAVQLGEALLEEVPLQRSTCKVVPGWPRAAERS